MFDLLCAWAQELPNAYLDMPFGPDVYTYKVYRKIFLFIHLNFDPLLFTLKVDPQDALALRRQYTDLIPGYHLNKRHWISLREDTAVPKEIIRELVHESYELVVKKTVESKRVASNAFKRIGG